MDVYGGAIAMQMSPVLLQRDSDSMNFGWHGRNDTVCFQDTTATTDHRRAMSQRNSSALPLLVLVYKLNRKKTRAFINTSDSLLDHTFRIRCQHVN